MSQPRTNTYTSLRDSKSYLIKVAKRLSNLEYLEPGYISFRLTGLSGGNYFIFCTTKEALSYEGIPPTAPIIEVIGDAGRIQSILEGRKDARKQFLAGGFRFRGNLRYLNDIALGLGIIDSH